MLRSRTVTVVTSLRRLIVSLFSFEIATPRPDLLGFYRLCSPFCLFSAAQLLRGLARNGFPAFQPLARYALQTRTHDDNAADNGACCVPITKPAHGGPKRLLIIVQMVGSDPQNEWNGVLCCDVGTVAQYRGCPLN